MKTKDSKKETQSKPTNIEKESVKKVEEKGKYKGTVIEATSIGGKMYRDGEIIYLKTKKSLDYLKLIKKIK